MASGWPASAMMAMPAIMLRFWTEARIVAMRDLPTAISMELRQADRTDAGIASDMTLTNCTVSARASASNWPTSTPTHGAASAYTATATRVANSVSRMARAADRGAGSPCSLQDRCRGIRTEGSMSLCTGATGSSTAVSAPRKLSATMLAPSSRAISTSRAKPSSLPNTAPPTSQPARRRLNPGSRAGLPRPAPMRGAGLRI